MVSNKRLLPDLREWDPQLAIMLEDFAVTSNVTTKFEVWSEIIDHMLKPIGGRQPIAENNCDCEVCKKDLSNLAEN